MSDLIPVAYPGPNDAVVAEGHVFNKDEPVFVPADTAESLVRQGFVLLDDSLVIIDTPTLTVTELVPDLLVSEPETVGLWARSDLSVYLKDGTDYVFPAGQTVQVDPEHVEDLLFYGTVFALEGQPLPEPVVAEPLVDTTTTTTETTTTTDTTTTTTDTTTTDTTATDTTTTEGSV